MAGIASRRSMMQYAAVARMRMQMLAHSARTGRGKFDIVAQIATWSTYLFLGTLFAAGFAMGAFHILYGGHLGYFSLLIWGALLMWQFTPIMAISFREEYDLSGLARYPLGFGAYYILFIFFGFFDLSTIFGLASLLGIAIGVSLARPALLPIGLLALAIFAAFNILLNRAIFAWLSRWLARRRSREILGVFFFIVVVAAELMNPALHEFHLRLPANLLALLKILIPFDALFPPGLVSGGMLAVTHGHLLRAALSLAGLAAWTILPGATLAARLRAQYRGENLSEAPARKPEAAPAKGTNRPSRFDVTGPVAAVMVKEARYLMRSYQLLYGLVAPLILMLVFTGTPRHHHTGALVAPEHLLLPLAVLYAFLGLTRLIFNSLGSEGTGLQFYFASPAPFWKIMLGKNLFHMILLAIEIVVLWVIAVLRAGLPSAETMAITLCAMTFIVPANFLAANLVSLHVPYRMNLTRIQRSQGATANNLVSLLAQLVVGGVSAIAYFVAYARGGPWLAAIILLAMGVVASLAYWLVLRGLGTRARRRIEPLLSDLARTAS